MHLWPFTHVRVAETSMQPTLQPGDRLIVLRWSRPRVGDLVVLRDPAFRSRLLVKRVAGRTADGSYIVQADNPNVGSDSRHLGPLAGDLLVGKVMWRYGGG
ncbi:MAG TPA: S26 family signal peptidase [Chloroflexota bacterium]|nr:S26 family signal peptidase [Chloroflexota bacterium]